MARPSHQSEENMKFNMGRWHITMDDIATSDIVARMATAVNLCELPVACHRLNRA
jgi:hypothetical protein